MREEQHWTQQHLADAAVITLRTIQRVERGEGASAETLQALAAVFDTTIDQLQMDWDAVAGASSPASSRSFSTIDQLQMDWDAVAAVRRDLLEESNKQEKAL